MHVIFPVVTVIVIAMEIGIGLGIVIVIVMVVVIVIVMVIVIVIGAPADGSSGCYLVRLWDTETQQGVGATMTSYVTYGCNACNVWLLSSAAVGHGDAAGSGRNQDPPQRRVVRGQLDVDLWQ